MSPRASHSSAEREASRNRWAAFVRPHWKHRLAHPHILTKRETTVLSLRLGLTGSPLSQLPIARRLGVSPNTVAALELSARRKVIAALTLEGHAL